MEASRKRCRGAMLVNSTSSVLIMLHTKAMGVCVFQVYYQECEMFGHVVKMLIAKDPSLEAPIQSSLQENLRDIGQRCVEAMKTFIEDYDSKEPPR